MPVRKRKHAGACGIAVTGGPACGTSGAYGACGECDDWRGGQMKQHAEISGDVSDHIRQKINC